MINNEKLKNKNILLISPEPWDHISVSKHHYAIHLAKRNNKVFFLNPPGEQFSLRKTEFQGVFNVNYRGFLKGLRFFSSSFQRKQIKKKYVKLEKLCELRFNIVWSFDNSVFSDFSALPANVLKISHIVDLNQNFQKAKAASTADFCFGVSKSIVDSLKVYNKNTYFIQHGFTYSTENKTFNLDDTYVGKVGYAGNLDLRYIDWELIKECITKNINIKFYFAGPFSLENKNIIWLKNQPNVELLGKIKSTQMLSFYHQMDMLFLCYRINEFKEQLTNSHKMMEYLASGKMICATFTKEYEALQKENLIAMALEKQTFPELFKEVLSNLESWNTAEKQFARRSFAYENTYEKQLDRIELILNHVR